MTEVNGMSGTVNQLNSSTFEVNGVSADPAETTGGVVEIYSSAFPDEYIDLVVKYGAIKSLENKMASLHADIPSHTSGDWNFIQNALENEEDIELASARSQQLGVEMQQWVAEYQWYSNRANALKQEYMATFAMSAPKQPGGDKK